MLSIQQMKQQLESRYLLVQGLKEKEPGKTTFEDSNLYLDKHGYRFITEDEEGFPNNEEELKQENILEVTQDFFILNENNFIDDDTYGLLTQGRVIREAIGRVYGYYDSAGIDMEIADKESCKIKTLEDAINWLYKNEKISVVKVVNFVEEFAEATFDPVNFMDAFASYETLQYKLETIHRHIETICPPLKHLNYTTGLYVEAEDGKYAIRLINKGFREQSPLGYWEIDIKFKEIEKDRMVNPYFLAMEVKTENVPNFNIELPEKLFAIYEEKAYLNSLRNLIDFIKKADDYACKNVNDKEEERFKCVEIEFEEMKKAHEKQMLKIK